MNEPPGQKRRLETPDGGAAARPGLRAGLARTLGGLAGYLSARLELAAEEGGEALRRLVALVAGLAAALIVAAVGWLLLAVAFCFLAGPLVGVSPAVMGVVLGILHLLLAAAAARFALRRRGSLFQETLRQFQKDREWLANLGKRG